MTGARGHDLFLDFLGKAFNVPEAFPDLIVTFEEGAVHAHKFLLAVRAPAIGECLPPKCMRAPPNTSAAGNLSQALVLHKLGGFCSAECPMASVSGGVRSDQGHHVDYKVRQ